MLHPTIDAAYLPVKSQPVASDLQRHQPDSARSAVPTRSGWTRFAVWIADRELWLLAVAVPLLMVTNRLPAGVIWFALALVALAWLARWTALGYHLTVPTPADLPLAVLVVVAVGSMFVSVRFGDSVIGLHKIIALVALFYGLVNTLQTAAGIRHFTVLFLLAGMAASLASLIVIAPSSAKLPFVSTLYDALPTILPRTVKGNYAAGTVVVFLPLSVSLFFAGAELAPRWMSGSAAALVTATVVLTQSRSALLAAGVGLGVLGVWATRWFLAILPALAAAGWWLVRYGSIEILIDPISDSGSALSSRVDLWRRGLYIIQDFPFTGISTGTFDTIVQALYPLHFLAPSERLFHAHNFYLQTAVEFGLPGLIAYVGLVVAVLTVGWNLLHEPAIALGYRALAVGLMAGLAANLAFGLTDAIVVANKSSVFVWAAFGLLCCLRRVTSSASATDAAAGIS